MLAIWQRFTVGIPWTLGVASCALATSCDSGEIAGVTSKAPPATPHVSDIWIDTLRPHWDVRVNWTKKHAAQGFPVASVSTSPSGRNSPRDPRTLLGSVSSGSAVSVAEPGQVYRFRVGYDSAGKPVAQLAREGAGPQFGPGAVGPVQRIVLREERIQAYNDSGRMVADLEVPQGTLSHPDSRTIGTGRALQPLAVEACFSLRDTRCDTLADTLVVRTSAPSDLGQPETRQAEVLGFTSREVESRFVRDASAWRRVALTYSSRGGTGTRQASQSQSFAFGSRSRLHAPDEALVSFISRDWTSLKPRVATRHDAGQSQLRMRTPNLVLPQPPCPGTGSILPYYQHGFQSDASTWNRTRTWVCQDFLLKTDAASTTPWQARLIQQADLIAPSLAAELPLNSQYLLVGHSQGGLIVRDVAQRPAFQGKVRGVLTIDSPHGGVPLTTLGLSDLLTWLGGETGGALSTGCYDYVSAAIDVQCRAAGLAGYNTFGTIMSSLWSLLLPAVPVVADHVPGNLYHAGLDLTPENFLSAGITSVIPNRWNVLRLICESFSDSDCYDTQSNADVLYWVMVSTYLLRLWAEDMGIFFPVSAGQILAALTVLDAVDFVWLVASGQYYSGGDSFIPSWSQMYSGLTTPGFSSSNQIIFLADTLGPQFEPRPPTYGSAPADGHQRNTRGLATAKAVKYLMLQQFSVPPRP